MDRLKELLDKLKNNGVPLIFFRDYATGKPSITFTMSVVSFVLCVLSVIAKFDKSSFFGDIDYTETSNLLIISLGAYIGRKFQSNGKEASIEKEDK